MLWGRLWRWGIRGFLWFIPAQVSTGKATDPTSYRHWLDVELVMVDARIAAHWRELRRVTGTDAEAAVQCALDHAMDRRLVLMQERDFWEAVS